MRDFPYSSTEKKDVAFNALTLVDSTNQDTEGTKPSLMKFYLEPKLHKIEIAFDSRGPTYNDKARAFI